MKFASMVGLLAALLAGPAMAAKTHLRPKAEFAAVGGGALDRDPQLPSFFHTSEEIKRKLHELAEDCPGMALRTESKTSLVSGRSVSIDVVTIKAEDEHPKNKVFLLFGEHARELISAESGLHLIETLCSGSERAKQSLKNSEFMMVVNGNPDSRRHVEQGEWCIRMNPNGVDLNRNWDEHWNDFPANMGQTDVNAGSGPFSEPETMIFKQLVSDYEPTMFLTIHSGTLGMYMPWAFDMEHLADRNQQSMMQILKEVDQDRCQCPFGAAGKEVGYSCPGTCLDWVFDNLKTPYAFAYEIWGQGAAQLRRRWEEKVSSEEGSYLQARSHLAHDHFKDLFQDFPSTFIQVQSTEQVEQEEQQVTGFSCFTTYNPGTEESYRQTVDNWSQAYLDTADKVAKKLEEH